MDTTELLLKRSASATFEFLKFCFWFTAFQTLSFSIRSSCVFLLFISLFCLAFLARLHEVQRAIIVTMVVRVPIPVPLRSPFICKFFMSLYLDNLLSESLQTWTIGTLEG